MIMMRTDQEKVERRYNRWARTYDRRWAGYTEAVLSRALQQLQLTGQERVLDVACGTGELEMRIARQFPRQEVFGLDLSEAMLKSARRKLALYPNMHFSQGDSRQLAFPDAHFDIVVTCSAFHYMREPQRVITEFARVVKPGGRILIVDWCRDFLFAKIYNLLHKQFIPAHYQVHSWREMEQMMRTAGLHINGGHTFSVYHLWQMMLIEARRP